MLMYIACLCPNLVSVHFYAIPILHFKFISSIPHASLKEALISLNKEASKVMFLIADTWDTAYWLDVPSNKVASKHNITLVEYFIDNI